MSETAGRITIRCPSCAAWNRVDPARAAAQPKCGRCAAAIALDRPLALDDASFARTIAETDVPILVDFYADWCAPCRMMAPAVDALAAGTRGRALVAKLDTEQAVATAQRYGIRGLPTVIVFERGTERTRQTGAMPGPMLERLLGV